MRFRIRIQLSVTIVSPLHTVFFCLSVALFLCLAPQRAVASNKGSVTFLYFNDGHQLSPVMDSDGTRGGVARLKTVIDKQKETDKEALVLFGGDLAGGTLFGGVFKGFPMVEAFNRLPVDYATFGQHDFDFGFDNAMKLVEASSFQWISSNLSFFDGFQWSPLQGVLPYTTVIRNGVKIGILGITDAMDTSTREGIVKDGDPVKTARACASILKRLHCEVIVALTQTDLNTNTLIVEASPFIDVVLSEERFENRSDIHFIGSVPIVSPCGNLGSVVRIHVDSRHVVSCSVFPVSSSVPGEKAMETLEAVYENRMERSLSRIGGTVSGSSSLHESRVGFSYSGTLITDAFRDHFAADLAIMQGGGIRAPLKRGTFRKRDAMALLPFNNRLGVVKMTGETLLELLNYGLKDYRSLNGNFLHLSGGTYSFEDRKDGSSVVTSVLINDRPIQREDLYTVVVPAYLLAGGGGFDFSSVKTMLSPDIGPVDNEVLFAFVKKKGNL